MVHNILDELNVEDFRKVFEKYTIKAFEMIPKMKNPIILDAGCGAGTASIELTKHVDAKFIGIDIDQDVLDVFKINIEKLKLSSQITIFNRSVYDTKFIDRMFDIIWDQGVLHLLDINKVLEEYYRVLKADGFIAALETIKWFKKNLKSFSKHGFKVESNFKLPDECWWREYYTPMEERIKQLHIKYEGSKELKKLKIYENEINLVRKNPKEYDCAFYIFKKIKN